MRRYTSLLLCVVIGTTGCSEERVPEPKTPQTASKPEAQGSLDEPGLPNKDGGLMHFLAQESKPTIEVVVPESLNATYTNHVHVHSSDFEMIFDFGVLNTDQGNPAPQFVITRRIALSPYTAKRVSSALKIAIDRHEDAFGQIKGAEAQAQIKAESPDTVEYTNFCRVSSTPEELILHCGLNPEPYAAGPQSVTVSHTIVMLHTTAKRFHESLESAIEKYEKDHGHLEIDVRKRAALNLR